MSLFRPAPDAWAAPPWFRVHPRRALAVAALLFASVLALRLLDGRSASDAVSLLYVLPVALVAVAFGRTAGLLAGLVAVLLIVVWALTYEPGVSWLGWVTRAVPLLLFGALVGDAAERQAAAERRQRELEAAAQRHRDAAEISDSLIQGMAAARWALEAGRHQEGLTLLEDTLEQGHRLVSELLRDADLAPGRPTRRGDPAR